MSGSWRPRRPRVLAALLLVCGLCAGAFLTLRFGNPQWHPWVYCFQADVEPGYPGATIPPPPHYTGIWKQWYMGHGGLDGGLMVRHPYVDGQEDGLAVWFDRNGRVMLTEQMRHGKWHGERRTYYHGQLTWEQHYNMGQLDGVWRRWWYPNGKLKERGRYVDGYREGEWVWYGEEGAVLGKGVYRDGQPWQGMFAVDASAEEFQRYAEGEPVAEGEE